MDHFDPHMRKNCTVHALNRELQSLKTQIPHLNTSIIHLDGSGIRMGFISTDDDPSTNPAVFKNPTTQWERSFPKQQFSNSKYVCINLSPQLNFAPAMVTGSSHVPDILITKDDW